MAIYTKDEYFKKNIDELLTYGYELLSKIYKDEWNDIDLIINIDKCFEHLITVAKQYDKQRPDKALELFFKTFRETFLIGIEKKYTDFINDIFDSLRKIKSYILEKPYTLE